MKNVMSKGFIYVANQEKFLKEAIISAKSLKRFSNIPIAVILTENLVGNDLEIFDDTIIVNELQKYTYLSKIIGMQNTPYDKTIFLDSDTFICSSIDNLFDLLYYFDFSTTIESKRHTTSKKDLLLKNILPEFNTGVIVYNNNDVMAKVFKDWFEKCNEWQIKNDMPGFRESILINCREVRFSILPSEFNLHGLKTMTLIYGEVKVIHERYGVGLNSLTPYCQSFNKMDKLAYNLNIITYKRLYIKYIGLISYRLTPFNLIHKVKKLLGIKRYSKSTFF